MRGIEVFMLIDRGAWTLVDQKCAGALTLQSNDLTMLMAVVFKGIDQTTG